MNPVDLAIKEGMLSIDDDYSVLTQERFKEFFSRYKSIKSSTLSSIFITQSIINLFYNLIKRS